MTEETAERIDSIVDGAEIDQSSVKQIEEMGNLEAVFEQSGTVGWQWGGWIPDIVKGELVRPHGDLDYLYLVREPADTERLGGVLDQHGWVTKLEKGALVAHKGIVESGFIPVTREGDVIIWKPKDRHGTIIFPASWLPAEQIEFLGVETHVADIRFSYAMKMLSPEHSRRAKDVQDIEQMALLLKDISEVDANYDPNVFMSEIQVDPGVFSGEALTE